MRRAASGTVPAGESTACTWGQTIASGQASRQLVSLHTRDYHIGSLRYHNEVITRGHSVAGPTFHITRSLRGAVPRAVTESLRGVITYVRYEDITRPLRGTRRKHRRRSLLLRCLWVDCRCCVPWTTTTDWWSTQASSRIHSQRSPSGGRSITCCSETM